MLDGLPAATVASFRAPLPQWAVTDDLAVIAPAGFVISVVPVMFGADGLAVAALRCEAEVDQKPRQPATKPRAPFVRVPSHPLSLTTHPSNDLRLSGRRTCPLASSRSASCAGPLQPL